MSAGDKDNRPDSKNREQLLQTATRLFSQKGYAATGVRELAREADVSLAAVSYFFGSKKGLLEEVLEQFFDGHWQVLEEALDPAQSLEGNITAVVNSTINYFHANHRGLIVVMTEMPFDVPHISEFLAGKAQRLATVWQLVLEQHPDNQAAQDRIPVEVALPALISLMASHFLFAPVAKRISWMKQDQASLDAYPRQIARLFLYGYLGCGHEAGGE